MGGGEREAVYGKSGPETHSISHLGLVEYGLELRNAWSIEETNGAKVNLITFIFQTPIVRRLKRKKYFVS